MIIIKSQNADRTMNYKFAKEYEMISKVYKNVNKNKSAINIRDDYFQKTYCLSAIETENDHNLKFRSYKSLKLSAFNFFSVNQTH